MTDVHIEHDQNDIECLDEVLGDQLWQLSTPKCPADLRARLETHVTYCAACRLQLAMERKVEAGLRGGELSLPRPVFRMDRAASLTAACGTMALAAGLTLLLMLPPSAPHDGMVLRGDDGPAIERPVPDDVVLGGRPTLRWTPLKGATRYDVQVTAVDGDHTWSVSTREPEVTVPSGEDLPLDTRYRVRVAPVPAHVAPDGALRTSFRTGGTGAWLNHRLGHGSDWGRGLAGVGLAGMLAGALGLFVRRFSR